MVLVRCENHWSSPWSSEIVAITATSAAGTAAMMANMVTIRTCSPAPGSLRMRAWISSAAVLLVLTGLGFAFAEGGSALRKGIGIVFGLAIAFTATTFISTFFNMTAGAAF